jgi:hypothetical protein
MGAENTFYDYCEGGRNLIYEWLHGPAAKVRQKMNNYLLHLEALHVGTWQRPIVDTIDADMFEVRVNRYRIISCHGPGAEQRKQPTLLYGFIKNSKEIPPSDLREAIKRKERYYANPQAYREEHNYG